MVEGEHAHTSGSPRSRPPLDLTTLLFSPSFPSPHHSSPSNTHIFIAGFPKSPACLEMRGDVVSSANQKPTCLYPSSGLCPRSPGESKEARGGSCIARASAELWASSWDQVLLSSFPSRLSQGTWGLCLSPSGSNGKLKST